MSLNDKLIIIAIGAFGATLFDRYCPELRNCEVGWPIFFLVVVYPQLCARYQFTVGLQEVEQHLVIRTLATLLVDLVSSVRTHAD